jgi:hypothetical protein
MILFALVSRFALYVFIIVKFSFDSYLFDLIRCFAILLWCLIKELLEDRFPGGTVGNFLCLHSGGLSDSG